MDCKNGNKINGKITFQTHENLGLPKRRDFIRSSTSGSSVAKKKDTSSLMPLVDGVTSHFRHRFGTASPVI